MADMILRARLIEAGAEAIDDRLEGRRWTTVELYEAVADPVAVVRRGVESGTIEGMEIEWCKTHGHSSPPCGARMNCNIVPGLFLVKGAPEQ